LGNNPKMTTISPFAIEVGNQNDQSTMKCYQTSVLG